MRVISIYCLRDDPDWLVFDIDLAIEHLSNVTPADMDCCGVFAIEDSIMKTLDYWREDPRGIHSLAWRKPEEEGRVSFNRILLNGQDLMCGDYKGAPVKRLWPDPA